MTDFPGPQLLWRGHLKWGLCNYFCSCPSIFNKWRATLSVRDESVACALRGLSVLLVPWRVGSSLPVLSSGRLNPEPGVFWGIAKCTGSNDENCSSVIGKGPCSGNGWEGVLLVLTRFLHQPLDFLVQYPAEKQTWSLMAGSFVLCILSKSVTVTIQT